MVTVSGNPNPTNPTYPTNPANPTTKYCCEFVNLGKYRVDFQYFGYFIVGIQYLSVLSVHNDFGVIFGI